jgi:GrpB-like predicted nucleotidyltransferase (UPF0157 family)
MNTGSPLGLESRTVRIVPYDDRWPMLFASESERIRLALGTDLPLTIEHMGSTGVPGLAAKPILDLMGGYPAGAQVSSYIEALIRAGYVHRGEQEIPGREFFRRGDPRAYHLHLAVKDGTFWREHLAFRDALRSRPELREAYTALKLELARKFPYDREAYIFGKTDFVRGVVVEAKI